MKEAGLSPPLLIPISLVYLSGLFFDLGEGAFDFYVLLTAGKDLAAGEAECGVLLVAACQLQQAFSVMP